MPSLAQAGTASRSGAQLNFTAAPGEVNNVQVVFGSSAFRVRDTGAPVTPGPGCTAVNANTVNCAAAGITLLTLSAGDGDDAVSNTTETASIIDGGSGSDTLLGGNGEAGDRVNGGDGNDVINPNVGPDTVDGGAGDDTIASRGVHLDNINCGSGVDSALVDARDNVGDDCEFVDRPGAQGRAPRGSDVSLLPPSNKTACGVDRLGSARNDDIQGGKQGDNIFGLGGNDELKGGSGDDCLFGGDGADTLTGQRGSDRLQGDAGRDILRGSAGADGLLGGAGNDTLGGAAGNDGLLGGAGRDRVFGGSGKDGVSGGPGNDALSGGSGNDRLFGRAGRDVISGGSGRNRIAGGAGNDRINARNGKKDKIDCGPGRDRVRADADDKIRRCERVSRASS